MTWLSDFPDEGEVLFCRGTGHWTMDKYRKPITTSIVNFKNGSLQKQLKFFVLSKFG